MGHTYERRKKGRFDSEAGGSMAAIVSPRAAGKDPPKMQDKRFQRNLSGATLTIDRFVADEDVDMEDPSSSSSSSDDEFDEIEDESFRPGAPEIAEADEDEEDDEGDDEAEEDAEQEDA